MYGFFVVLFFTNLEIQVEALASISGDLYVQVEAFASLPPPSYAPVVCILSPTLIQSQTFDTGPP